MVTTTLWAGRTAQQPGQALRGRDGGSSATRKTQLVRLGRSSRAAAEAKQNACARQPSRDREISTARTAPLSAQLKPTKSGQTVVREPPGSSGRCRSRTRWPPRAYGREGGNRHQWCWKAKPRAASVRSSGLSLCRSGRSAGPMIRPLSGGPVAACCCLRPPRHRLEVGVLV